AAHCCFSHAAAHTEIYTLSLHDALPIWRGHVHVIHRRLDDMPEAVDVEQSVPGVLPDAGCLERHLRAGVENPSLLLFVRLPDAVDRKSTRLNSSHDQISYAVFCLKKKNR